MNDATEFAQQNLDENSVLGRRPRTNGSFDAAADVVDPHDPGHVQATQLLNMPLPLPMLQTACGSPLYTPIDMLQDVGGPYLLQLELLDVALRKGKYPPLRDTFKSESLSPLILSPRHMELGVASCIGDHLVLQTSSGHQHLTVDDYIQCVNREKPRAFVALADEVGPVCGKNRREKSLRRTLEWLKKMIECSSQLGCEVFAVSVGGTNMTARRTFLSQIPYENVNGMSIGEIFCGETYDETMEIVRTVRVAMAGQTMPLIAQGVPGPIEILDFIREGVDVIGTSFPLTITKTGHAVCWNINVEFTNGSTLDRDPKRQKVEETLTCGLINLNDRQFEMCHQIPLMINCTCHACRRHSRAYLHHLLRAHEMAAEILLYAHNQHQIVLFFNEIRQHKLRGTLDLFHEHVASQLQPCSVTQAT